MRLMTPTARNRGGNACLVPPPPVLDQTPGRNSMITAQKSLFALVLATMAVAAALTIAGSAQAASVKLLAMIPVPGEPIESYDIGTVDEKTHLYYQTDRSNKSIDIFDVIKNTFVG